MDNNTEVLQSIVNGTVKSINVQLGDKVAKGELLVVIYDNMLDIEVPLVSPCYGCIHSIEVEENEVVKSNTPLVIIETEK